MAIQMLVSAIWKFQTAIVLCTIPAVLAVMLMAISGHRSTHGTNYKKLLVWLFIFLANAALVYIVGYYWLLMTAKLGGAVSDLICGGMLLLIISEVALFSVLSNFLTTRDKK